MINYTVKAKKNPVDASVKFYPQIGKQKATDLEEIAKEISVMCTLSLPDIVSVLSATQEEVENVLKKGRSVRFGYLGSFRPTIVSNPVERRKTWALAISSVSVCASRWEAICASI